MRADSLGKIAKIPTDEVKREGMHQKWTILA